MVNKCLLGLSLVLAFSLFSTGCRHKDEPQLPVVVVDKPDKEDVQIFGEYVGRIRAASFVEIHARVEGYLEKMMFEEGKYVEQGDPLFIISPALYKAKVEKAKAQLKKDEVSAAKATRDVERLTPLYEQHAASQLDLDNAIAAKENAEANIAMSKADLDYLQSVTDAKGRKLKVHLLPLPSPIIVDEEECDALDPMDGEPTRVPGDRLAASYVNFYISNGGIIMPALIFNFVFILKFR